MIFPHTWQWVLDGTQTEVRQIKRPGEQAVYVDYIIHAVQSLSGRLKWQIGKSYAVQAGRNQKVLGQILLTHIAEEPLGWMKDRDALDAGFEPVRASGVLLISALEQYIDFWNTIHTATGETWKDNPTVWILRWELLVEKGEP